MASPYSRKPGTLRALAALVAVTGILVICKTPGAFASNASVPAQNPHGNSVPLSKVRSATANQQSPPSVPMFCWLAYGTGRDDRVAYITKAFMSPIAAGSQGQIADQFEAFVRKTYGQTTRGASCPADASLAATEKGRDVELDDLRDPRYAKIRIVEVDWVPTVPAPVPTAAPKPTASGPPPTAQQKFEQAMAAERPASTGTPPAPKPSTAPSVRATTPIPHAAVAPTEKYSYCIAVDVRGALRSSTRT